MLNTAAFSAITKNSQKACHRPFLKQMPIIQGKALSGQICKWCTIGLYKLALLVHSNTCILSLFFYLTLRQTNLCFLQTCKRNIDHKNRLLNVLVKHSGSGWEYTLACTASSRWRLHSRVLLPTLLLVLMPWNCFRKCDHRTIADVSTPCCTENQNPPARGRATHKTDTQIKPKTPKSALKLFPNES